MNKTAIKNFAVWARNKLEKDIAEQAELIGVSEKGIVQPLAHSTDDLLFLDIGTKEYAKVEGKTAIAQRKALIDHIKSKEADMGYARAYHAVIEEIAYTWFNRLIAIRFMEVNGYLPTRSRMLSSENSAKDEPDFVTSPFDTDVEFSDAEVQEIYRLKDDASKEASDELFCMLFIKLCNNLYEILPELFEKTNDYTEPLLSLSFADKDGIVYHLVHDIAEDDFNVEKEGQVEIIGWIYQFYISEKHEKVVNAIDKATVAKEDIPAATQLFTTDWVVRYMVDNSLGRYWIERNPTSTLRSKLSYFVMPKDGKIKYINEKIDPTELTLIDPCMGSGHILIYAFEVLMEIYREVGYTDRDAAKSILENNIFGLDIDERAYQLAYFALMMKARSYNRRILSAGISPNICSIEESNGCDTFVCKGITNERNQNEIGEYLIKVFKHAKEIGSLQSVKALDYKSFTKYVDDCEVDGQIDIFALPWIQYTAPLAKKLSFQALIMSKKYCVVCTNPPYLNKLEGHLKELMVDQFKAYGSDLFSAFIYHNFYYCKAGGYNAFMTPNVWMFISSYMQLREFLIKNKSIITLVQMAKGAFFKEAAVDICSFVVKNESGEKGTYIRLENFKGDMDVQNTYMIKAINEPCDYVYEKHMEEFMRIQGNPIAYWLSDKLFSIFESALPLKKIAEPKVGLQTGNNDAFLRLWHEVNISDIGFNFYSSDEAKKSNLRWFPYNKGGEYRRWFGNRYYVVDWQYDGDRIKHCFNEKGKLRSRPQNTAYYFKPSITWSDLTSASFSGRYCEGGFIFDVKGSSGFPAKDKHLYVLGFLNSKISQECISVLNPTMTTQVGDMARIPVFFDMSKKMEIDKLVQENVDIARQDWDSFDISWDFATHPLILEARASKAETRTELTIEEAFDLWEKTCENRFYRLKSNEESLNRIFIDIYGLHDELTPEVEEKDITVRKADLEREIRSLLSYAVGCMFGRYSLDSDGLAYAGGTWDDSKYITFRPDKDNCIPITDEEYFEDDIVDQFVGWMKKAFGEENLEANLDFIAKALGNNGATSREVIRNYFLNDFMKDHIRIYQKRPIYWLFDSGKQNGFKALVYMHRWNADTVGNLRVEYLHKMQHTYEREIVRMQETIDNSHNSREISKAIKRKDNLQKQLKETKDYDAKLSHIALSRIKIDLNDGVKVNYEKVQTGRDGKKMQILAKI